MAIPTLNQAGTHNFVIEKGATFDPYVHWATELGIGIDVSSVDDIRMQIRKTKRASGRPNFVSETLLSFVLFFTSL